MVNATFGAAIFIHVERIPLLARESFLTCKREVAADTLPNDQHRGPSFDQNKLKVDQSDKNRPKANKDLIKAHKLLIKANKRLTKARFG
mgnify:CR=1 FL=1